MVEGPGRRPSQVYQPCRSCTFLTSSPPCSAEAFSLVDPLVAVGSPLPLWLPPAPAEAHCPHCPRWGFSAHQKQTQEPGLERREGRGPVKEVNVGLCHLLSRTSEGTKHEMWDLGKHFSSPRLFQTSCRRPTPVAP